MKALKAIWKVLKIILLTLGKVLYFIIKYLCLGLWEILKFLFKEIKKYPELVVIPTMLICWYGSIKLLYYIDGGSGTFDYGVFQIIIFSAIQFSVYLSLAWLLLKMFNGTVRKFIQFDFKKVFKELQPWEKIKFSFCVFGFIILCYVLLARVLLVTPLN